MHTPSFALKSIVSGILAALPLLAAAADESDPPQADTAKITVVGTRSLSNNPSVISDRVLNRRRAANSDTASLLDEIPGVGFYGSGGVSSLPVIHGLNDDRIRVEVDGMEITSACGNHMNPPLSYMAPSNLESVSVFAGITPVSAGGDSIGGTISVRSALPEFAAEGQSLATGSLGAFYRSNGDGNGANLSATLASENFSARVDSSASQAGNYKAGNGVVVKSTRYATQNTDLTLAGRNGDSLLILNLGMQYIPYQAYPNARMDMTENQAEHFNLRYLDKFSWGDTEAQVYYNRARHEMNMLQDKSGNMPMNTDGKNLGYSISASIPLRDQDVLRIGNELLRFKLDDWWPPVSGGMGGGMGGGGMGGGGMGGGGMGPNTYVNINDGRRDRLGTFAEWEAVWSPAWRTSLGARYDRVSMDTGDVQPYSMTTMIPDVNAAKVFNTLDRKRVDNNFDVTALVRYSPEATSSYEAGYARKTRSPNLYERYTWGGSPMAMNMTGWFGDANGYVGNPDLKPEVAHTVSATGQWKGDSERAWSLRVTPYFSYVNNYIDVDRCPVAAMGPCSVANLTESKNFVYLQFVNHDARLYGLDVSGALPLAASRYGDFQLKGIAAYAHGKNSSTGDNLFRIMPLNLKLTLEHALGDWSSAVEWQLVAGKHDTQAVRNEVETAGYGLLNLRTHYDWGRASVDVGIENVLNKYYEPPLGGAYVGGPTKVWGYNVPGVGRSFYLALNLKF
ncbi:MAG: TonB-dependent receptor [Betaproteobacteria bacterium]|nr:TonB-dependent receptor [Betaproteobacteria bacterium]